MGASISRPDRKRTWWGDFCDFVADVWGSFKIKFTHGSSANQIFATMQELPPLASPDQIEEKREHSTNTSLVYQSSDELSDAEDEKRPIKNTYSKVATATKPSTPKSSSHYHAALGLIEVNDSPQYSSQTVAAAQNTEWVKPVTLFRAGIIFLTLAGFTATATVASQLYPMLVVATMLAILGAGLMITAYALNDEKKNGSLLDQTFPQQNVADSHPLSHAW